MMYVVENGVYAIFQPEIFTFTGKDPIEKLTKWRYFIQWHKKFSL